MELERKTIENDEEYLRQISKPVDFKKDDWKIAIKELDYFCKNDDNIMALASIQLGIPLRVIYLKKTNLERLDEDYNEERVLINPKIESLSTKYSFVTSSTVSDWERRPPFSLIRCIALSAIFNR